MRSDKRRIVIVTRMTRDPTMCKTEARAEGGIRVCGETNVGFVRPRGTLKPAHALTTCRSNLVLEIILLVALLD